MLRFLLALPVALIVCYSLIGVMAWMVDLNTRPSKPDTEPLMFDIFVSEKEQASERRKRTLPEPPEPEPEEQTPELPEQQQQLVTATTEVELESIPDVKLDLSVTGMKVSVPVMAVKGPVETTPVQPVNVAPVKIGQTQQVMPLKRIEPNYPRKALQRKIEGYVTLRFNIDKSGKPTEIEVIDQNPARIFNRDAIKALSRWRYQPKMVNGIAQVRVGQQVKLEFRIRK